MSGKLGRGVCLVGAGMSRFGAFPDRDSRDLFAEAFRELVSGVDKGLDPGEIEALYVGNFSSDLFEHQGHLAPILADWVGLTPRAALRLEDACASGGVALRQAVLAVAGGAYDVVLAAGVERMTALPTEAVTDALATAGDVLYEFPAGFTFPGFYAAMATAYAARYGMPYEALWEVARKNHRHASLNDKAQFPMTIREIMERRIARARDKGGPVPGWKDEHDFLRDEGANPPVAWPLRLFDCSPITDGAAAVLVVAEGIARRFTHHPVRVLGTGQASDACLYGRLDLTSLRAAREAAAQAYATAGVSPRRVRVAEVHDCFTIAEVLAIEDLGFFPPGQGWRATVDGATAREGPLPVNTSGGLKAKGHPVGASGVAQVVELWKQLRGEAGPRQVPGEVDLALSHNVGGTGQTCVVHILGRD